VLNLFGLLSATAAASGELHKMANRKMVKAYVNANREAVAESDNPHALITVLFDELIRSMRLYMATNRADQNEEDTHLGRALTIIYGLQSSLDFDKGGEIAENLYQLYEYSRQQLLKAARGEDASGVTAAIESMESIREAWYGIDGLAAGSVENEGNGS